MRGGTKLNCKNVQMEGEKSLKMTSQFPDC